MSHDTCTWMDCAAKATHPQRDKDGAIWANLCSEHDAEQTAALAGDDMKAILRCWVRAQGGAKAATKRMLGGS